MKYPKISAKDIKGATAIMPTPVKDGSESWKATDVVDLDETERALKDALTYGIDGLWTTGTYGEGATLLWDEIKAYTEVVVATVNKKIPVFVGATTMNTRETIERGKILQDMGVDGLFLGRPMWCALDNEGMVQFYKDVAEALPEMPIVVYDNPDAFKGKIPNVVYAELAKIPQVIASKYRLISSGLNPESYINDLKAVDGKIKLMPIDADWYYAAKWFPEEADAAWSPGAFCGPAPLIKMRDLIYERNWEEGEVLAQEIAHTYETFLPDGSFEKFNKYNIQIEKVHFNAAGYMKVGPSLPPYQLMPEKYVKGAEECGIRWRKLHDKYVQAK